MEATVITMRCTRGKRPYGVRVQKTGGDWVRTWAYEMTEAQMKHEGYDQTSVNGSLSVTSEYPGCPHCGTMGFVQCGRCHKMTCYNGETALTCQWCGTMMDNLVSADRFDVEGGRF